MACRFADIAWPLRRARSFIGSGRVGRTAIVVGAGIFGVATALELARRGWSVTLFEAGAIPAPRASSTDISKAVRSDYGADRTLTALAREAIEGWERWNRDPLPPLYHPVGFLGLRGDEAAPGDFEFDCHATHRALGDGEVDWIDLQEVARRWPGIDPRHYRQAYFNPRGGYAESSAVVSRLAARARDCGVRVVEGTPIAQLQDGPAVLPAGDDSALTADQLVVCAGAWARRLLPELGSRVEPTGHPVLHFDFGDQLRDAPMWCADISRSGWYGFPTDRQGRFKVGHHGEGSRLDPDRDHEPTVDQVSGFRTLLASLFPAGANAPIVGRRVCFYSDTPDGDFLIDRLPERPGLVVAGGGNGHGFKFAPLIGRWVADLVDGYPDPRIARFGWNRAFSPGREQARSAVEAGSLSAGKPNPDSQY